MLLPTSSRLTLLLLLALPPNLAPAQSNVDGFIYGHAAPGTTVSVIAEDGGARVDTVSDANGEFRLVALAPGRYELRSGEAVVNVVVRIGGGTQVRLDATAKLDTIEVTAERAAIDVSRAVLPFEISEHRLDAIPLPRELTGVVLLAPGTHLGDPGFGELASIGGATVAENQYYLNGFNISDLRTRLSPSDVPFEFYREFQVMTGGYSAEFSRATGGVVNAVSKRGGDAWEASAQLTLEPEQTRARKPSVFVNGAPLYYYGADREDSRIVDMSIGGPLIRDRLYVFALGSLEERQSETLLADDYFLSFQRGDFHDNSRTRAPFGALALDGQIAPGHTLNVTAFSDEAEEEVRRSPFDKQALRPAAAIGRFRQQAGGQTHILRYTGALSDVLTLSAVAGQGSVDYSRRTPATDCPYVQDTRSGVPMVLGCWVTDPTTDRDERRAWRVDLQWEIGDHLIRGGFDTESNASTNRELLSGDAQYIVYRLEVGDPIGATGAVAPAAGDYVEQVLYRSAGSVRERLQGLYLEDRWQIGDRLAIQLGLRLDRFENVNTLGQTFVSLRADPAPRLGLTWDLWGDASAKLFASYGHYYTPVGTEATVRQGTEYFAVNEAYDFEGYAADDTRRPILGTRRGGTVFGDGSVPNPLTAVATDVEPSYHAETIFGIHSRLPTFFDGQMRISAAYIHRDLKRTVEDVALDQGLNALLDGEAHLLGSGNDANLQDCDGNLLPDHFACGFDFYYITNPGQDVTVFLPTDAASGRYDASGSGPLRALNLPAEVLGYERARRHYHAIELGLDAVFNDGGFVQGSYTWSQSNGNYEGIVNSTIQQANVAITQDFDQPGLLDGADGRLANDRRHRIKLFGSWPFHEDWSLGFATYAQSGRPYSALGYFRDLESPEAAYGQFSFYSRHPRFTDNPEQTALVPRGSAGHSPWLLNLDLALNWQPRWVDGLNLSVEVFNVLNQKRAILINEVSEDVSGAPSPAYAVARDFQEPRAMRLRIALSL